MALPEFNAVGDLPAGIHTATLDEVLDRFGTDSARRQEMTARLQRVHELAVATGFLDRLIVFGSYVSDKADPRDVDVLLIMRDDFRPDACPPEARVLLDHNRAASELGASIFWLRPSMLIGERLDSFIAQWQIKRDGTLRGIVEIQT